MIGVFNTSLWCSIYGRILAQLRDIQTSKQKGIHKITTSLQLIFVFMILDSHRPDIKGLLQCCPQTTRTSVHLHVFTQFLDFGLKSVVFWYKKYNTTIKKMLNSTTVNTIYTAYWMSNILRAPLVEHKEVTSTKTKLHAHIDWWIAWCLTAHQHRKVAKDGQR